MENLSPNAEPVAWSTLGGLLAGAVLDWLNVISSSPTGELLTYVIPLVVANFVVRFKVYAPDTHEAAVKQAMNRPASDPAEWGTNRQ